jgi:diketogulonate reductase-like aldo/keto reductase
MRERVVMDIGEKHGKSPAQVLLRWGVQSGTVVIPKTQKVSKRIESGHHFGYQM